MSAPWQAVGLKSAGLVNHIWAVRHARIEVAHGLCYGHTDWQVDADATQHQAAQLAQQLPALPIISSPLLRCRQLAQALADLTQQPLRIEKRLIEMNFGDWEGLPWAQIERRDLDTWAANPVEFAAPNGESFADLISRVKAVQREQKTSAIWITHAGVIRALTHVCHTLPLTAAASVEVPYLLAHPFSRPGPAD